jgi:Holliday junction resolvase RusA-like endonuclease
MTVLRFILSTPPPSVNSSTAVVNGRKIKSAEYRAWFELVGHELNRQRGKLPDPCYWSITVHVPRSLTRADVGNLEKGAPDLLRKHGCVPDDRHCVRTTVEFCGGDKVLIDVEKCDLETWLPIMRPGKDLERRLRNADRK